MIDRDLFPFKSNYFKIDEGKIHYVDEGDGPVIVFSHGTPEWSFSYRHLIKELSQEYRCIALDHFGFGLSDKPAEADYSIQKQSQRFEKFIDHLGLTNINLVCNDFGLSIALSAAIQNPDRISKICISNGWMWSLKNEPHFAQPGKLLQGWLGDFLYRHLNFPIKVMLPQAYGDKSKFTRQIKQHFEFPFEKKKDRNATIAYAREILNAGQWWEEQWNQLGKLDQKSFLIFWGMKDKFVRECELQRWQSRLKHYQLIALPHAGHFVHEEEPERMIQELRQFFV